MNFKYIPFALAIATTSLFGNQPFRTPAKEKSLKNEKDLKADIIVLGGGAAGCVLMNKLSKNGRFSVLGIEAGPNLTHDSEIKAVGLPALLLPATTAYKYFWWGWKQTKPESMLNGRVGGDWVTGMMLGGGSSVNGLYYGRGSNAV